MLSGRKWASSLLPADRTYFCWNVDVPGIYAAEVEGYLMNGITLEIDLKEGKGLAAMTGGKNKSSAVHVDPATCPSHRQ